MGRALIRLLIVLSAFALAGCFRSNQPPQFYMLRALDTGRPAKAVAAGDGPLIGLGPIRIPAYLDRYQIVTAVSSEEYALSDNHRWAERLEVTLARVSAENLSNLIPTERIVLHPWPREPKPELQVAIDIRDLFVDPAGTARLKAQWTFRYASGTGFLSREFSCQLPASTTDYARMVDIESQCLARLNRDIADAIRNADRNAVAAGKR